MKSKRTASNIRSVHKSRKMSTRTRVLKAINLLEKEGERVTFASVANVSGITRATLYNHADLKKLISEKREAQHSARRRYDGAMADLRRENNKLRKKVENQRSWIEVLNDTGPVMRDEDLVTKLR